MAIETLQCKDFRVIKDGEMVFGEPKDVLETINIWMSENAVRVVNVESIFNTGSGFSMMDEFDGARVWFMAAGKDE
jgi:hypothetical protein